MTINYISILFLTIAILIAISLILNFFIFYVIPFFIFKDYKLIFRSFLRSRFTFHGFFLFPYLLTITNKGFNNIFDRIFFYKSVKETNNNKLIYQVNILRRICRISSLFISLIFLIFIIIAFIAVIGVITSLIVNGGTLG